MNALAAFIAAIKRDHDDLCLFAFGDRHWRRSGFVVVLHVPVLRLGTRGHSWAVLATLAHELGHYLSWTAGTFKPGTPSEESRAWRLGFAELRRYGMAPTPAMARMRTALLRRRRSQLSGGTGT